ncbi:Uma2 family endonuclease [Botrimarina sp.]|uniref:Uma2 family endonuclease n=1 Tax=Botrimarina sp. TaxID=2795802 RepID=UPI0032EC7DC9
MSTDAQAQSTAAGFNVSPPALPPAKADLPPLENGDRLSRAEFERRYEAMPEIKKAELVDGVVYLMSSPVSNEFHGAPHFELNTWLGVYSANTAGVEGCDNATLRLDWDNEPQPDAALRVLPGYGGQSTNDGQYVGGAPELCCEIAATSASYDLHQKKDAFRRSGVREYLVWRTRDRAIDWFALRGGVYEPLSPNADGVLQSEVFPGLWLPVEAMLARDMPRVLATLNEGLQSDAYRQFRDRLAEAGPTA